MRHEGSFHKSELAEQIVANPLSFFGAWQTAHCDFGGIGIVYFCNSLSQFWLTEPIE
jgi:hypothetical protein